MDIPTSPLDEKEPEQDTFPLEPRYHPIHKLPRKIFDFLASSRLAMVLLVTILACCIAGVTVWREVEAGRVIFATIWFNAILVLLVVNVACCFFGRIWGRRVTVISFGMILFHLSFVAILLGVVYNSMFYFRGKIRLTEGEVLPSSVPQSYDWFDNGKFFNFARLRGETTLIKMHSGYKVDGDDKRAAYEVAVGEGADRTQGIMFITQKLSHHRVDYFNDREGYSLLLTLSDKFGRYIYGGFMPLQSIKKLDGSYRYAIGYTGDGKVIEEATLFPAPPEKPLVTVKVEYNLSPFTERGGDIKYIVYPLDQNGSSDHKKPLAEGKAPIGGQFAVGEYLMSAEEVRYWVGMSVRYEPGKPIVLTSLWVALAGMIITTIGRIFRGRESVKVSDS